MLRIMGGVDRGRKLKSPPGTEFRPSTGRVKEFIFSYLHDIREQQVLDLFSGTGSIGIDAISRGASSVTFVEQSHLSLKILTDNINVCRYNDRSTIIKSDVFSQLDRFGEQNRQFDLIIADPPFKAMLQEKILVSVTVNKLLREEGILIIEHEQHDEVTSDNTIQMIRQKKFGHCVISIYGG